MARGTATDDTRLTARAVLVAIGAALALSGCGSTPLAELPPAAGPDRSPPPSTTPAGTVTRREAAPAAPPTSTSLRDGTLVAKVLGRERVFDIVDEATGRRRSRATAGVGPTNVACAPQGPCFVVDTQGDALLVFRVGAGGDDLRLTRRVYLAGAPYGIAIDPERRRLWVTLTARNEVVELGAHGRPHVLQRLPTVRQPDAVSVDPGSGDVTILGSGGAAERIADPASADR